jgi:hypothetical protein
MEFEKKKYVPSALAEIAKLFVNQHPLFAPQQQALGMAEIPFNHKMAGWMWEKNIETMSMVRMGVEFFLGLYLRDVVMKRAPGVDGFDGVTGAPTRLCNSAIHTQWCSRMLHVVQTNLIFLDQFMFTYLCAATAGELRHAPSRAPGVPKTTLSKWNIVVNGKITSRTLTQAQFLKSIAVAESPQYLDDADNMFRNYAWSGSYGGKKWADIAKTGRDRAKQETDPVLFIDRVFDLKHNGGPMFDKNSIISQPYLPHFLDAKFHLKTDTSWQPWFKYITSDMAEVLNLGCACGLWTGGEVTPKTINLLTKNLWPVVGTATGVADVEEVDEDDSTSNYVPKNPSFILSDPSCPKGIKH